jgi:hypothetical protein
MYNQIVNLFAWPWEADDRDTGKLVNLSAKEDMYNQIVNLKHGILVKEGRALNLQGNMCVDNAGTALDSGNDGCAWYEWNQDHCWSGLYDDDDFAAGKMCCTCGGGD